MAEITTYRLKGEVVLRRIADEDDETSYIEDELGPFHKVEESRLDNTYVQIETSEFDFGLGAYVVVSRTQEHRPLVIPKTEIELLREENTNLKFRISDVELALTDLITAIL